MPSKICPSSARSVKHWTLSTNCLSLVWKKGEGEAREKKESSGDSNRSDLSGSKTVLPLSFGRMSHSSRSRRRGGGRKKGRDSPLPAMTLLLATLKSPTPCHQKGGTGAEIRPGEGDADLYRGSVGNQ